jgi:colicin import membrane protein
MNKILISRNNGASYTGGFENGKASGFGLFAAIALHIGLFLLMVIVQQHTPINKKLPPSVQVDLVSYSPKLEDLLKSDKKPPKKVIKKKTETKKKPKPKKKIIKKSVKKIAKPVEKNEKIFSEKKKPDTSKALEEAKEKIKEKVEEQEQNKIRDILAELQEKVEEQESQDDYEEEEIEYSKNESWGGNLDKKSIYNSILANKIQNNWIITERLAQLARKNRTITVVVMIKILKNGDLGDIWIETKSGNSFLDQAAMRTVRKSVPFSPLPKEFQSSSYAVGLIFSPEGL